MEIIKAKNAGFCFGVKRAIDKVNEILDLNCKIYSTGPIIHNEKVCLELERKGLVILPNENSLSDLKNSKVIIRTHGIEKNIYDLLKKNGNEIIDLTCPFVSKIHNIVSDYSAKGYSIIVIGDKNHPEVKGIVSYSVGPIFVIINENDIKNINIPKNSNVLIVFQTTTNSLNAQKLVDILVNLFYNNKVINTVCNATENRQNEVLELSKNVDLMLIIGSYTSSNTKKLYEISKLNCENTYLLCDVSDMKKIDRKKYTKIGISAGASTPDYQVEEILTNARNEF